jgi:hypothetical protein
MKKFDGEDIFLIYGLLLFVGFFIVTIFVWLEFIFIDIPKGIMWLVNNIGSIIGFFVVVFLIIRLIFWLDDRSKK